MAYFFSQSVRNLLAKATDLKSLPSLCHRVAPIRYYRHLLLWSYPFWIKMCWAWCLSYFFFSIVQNHQLFLLSIPILRLFSIVSSSWRSFWIEYSKTLTKVVSSPEKILGLYCLWELLISLLLLFYLEWVLLCFDLPGIPTRLVLFLNSSVFLSLAR